MKAMEAMMATKAASGAMTATQACGFVVVLRKQHCNTQEPSKAAA
jgi:hypothetical protein